MTIHPAQTVFNKGELSPKLHARFDLEYYRAGLAACRNCYPLVQGGVLKRSGTRFVAPSLLDNIALGDSHAEFLPFIFSEEQAYVLEFGNLQLGFIALGGVVEESPGVRYKIATPYHANELKRLTGIQTADVVYLVHPDHPPHKLERKGETDWNLEPVEFVNGPWLDINVKNNSATTTGLARPGITIEGNSFTSPPPDRLLDKDPHLVGQGPAVDWSIEFDMGSGIPCAGYALTASSDGHGISSMVRKWAFQGRHTKNDEWVTLDTRVAEADWNFKEQRDYLFKNDEDYRYYRLIVEQVNGHASTATLGAIQLYLKKRAGTIEFANKENVNRGDGLSQADIGRQIRWQGKDGFFRYFTIQGVVSDTHASGVWEGFWEWQADSSKTWALGAFSKASGYPRAVTIFQERLAFASTKQQPRTTFFSASGDYEDFQIPDPLTDEAPITVTIAGARQDRIEWIAEVERLLMVATSDGIVSIGGTDNAVIKPDNVQQRRHAQVGAAPDIPPARVGTVLLFAGFHRDKLHELQYSVDADGYDAPALSILSDHFYTSQIAHLVYAQNPHDLLIMPNGDGDLISLTYEREQRVVGHGLLEFEGGDVLTCAVIPEGNRDTVYVLVRRTIDGQVRHYVERIQKAFDYGDDLSAWFVDSGLEYQGIPTDTITGLEHLEAQTVWVYGWNADPTDPPGSTIPHQGTYTVNGGQVVLERELTYALTGVPVRGRARLLQHALDTQDGASFGRAQHVSGVVASFMNSRAVDLRAAITEGNPDGIVEPILLRKTEQPMDSYEPLFTGEVEIPVEDSWEGHGVLEFVSDQPQPMLLRAVIPQIDREPGLSMRQGG